MIESIYLLFFQTANWRATFNAMKGEDHVLLDERR